MLLVILAPFLDSGEFIQKVQLLLLFTCGHKGTRQLHTTDHLTADDTPKQWEAIVLINVLYSHRHGAGVRQWEWCWETWETPFTFAVNIPAQPLRSQRKTDDDPATVVGDFGCG